MFKKFWKISRIKYFGEFREVFYKILRNISEYPEKYIGKF